MGSVAFAADGGTSSPPPKASDVYVEKDVKAKVETDAKATKTIDASKVPDPEKAKQSRDTILRMNAVLKDVLGKLEEAKNSRDVIKLNCVNDKLTQVKGLLRVSVQADIQLQEAIANKDSAEAEHEYTKVMIAGGKVDKLRSEAEECIGQLAFRTSENLQVDVTYPDYLPSGQLWKTVLPWVFLPPPPPASPTL